MKISELENKIDLFSLIANENKTRKVGGKEYRVDPCPACGGKDHFTVYPETNSYSSFSGCCQGGKVYRYLQDIKGLTEDQAFEELHRLAGIPFEKGTAVKKENQENKKSAIYPRPTKTEEETALAPAADYTAQVMELYHLQTDQDRAYFLDRKISNKLIDKYKLCIGKIGSDRRAILPVWENNKVTYYTGRALTDQQAQKYGKYHNATGSAQLFNSQYITNPVNRDPIIITEGIFDALSIEEAGGQAIALNSSSNVKKLLALCKEHRPKGRLVLALDNDAPGMQAHKELEKGLKGLGIVVGTFTIKPEFKDPNEFLKEDKEGIVEVLKRVINQAIEAQETERTEYLKNSTSNYVKDFFKQINESQNTPATSTGFQALNNLLDGGLYAGLYIIGAISSLGKTTFTLQMADQIAAGGNDVLIFSLEMARFELMAKSISRLTFLHDDTQYKVKAKTMRGITAGNRYQGYGEKEIDLIQLAVSKYSEFAGNIYVLEGMGDISVREIKTAVEKHKIITGKTPIIIIDYLQILAPYNERLNDKQNTDKSIVELKRMSRDYKTPVIAISSLNRENYNAPINMAAFKESGGIEYSADVLLGLQATGAGSKEFNIDIAKAKDPREVELKVLKNRNGKTGGMIEYLYYPKFNYFEEDKQEVKREGKRV